MSQVATLLSKCKGQGLIEFVNIYMLKFILLHLFDCCFDFVFVINCLYSIVGKPGSPLYTYSSLVA